MTNSSLSLVCDFVIFTIPIAIITMIKLSKERKVMLAMVLLPGTLVIVISCVRLYLCVVGQWRDDGSWYYNPQVAIEVAEIGGTLIALSVSCYRKGCITGTNADPALQIPGLKALIGTMYERMRSSIDHTYPSTGRGRITLTHGGTQDVAKPPHHSPGVFQTKTSVNARTNSRGSDSDEDLLASMGSRNIYVQTDVNQLSFPMAHLKRKTHDDSEV